MSSSSSNDSARNTSHLTLLSQVHHPPPIPDSMAGSLSSNSSAEPVDRITRYAAPNRFDSLDAPTSFLDSRPARSRSKARGSTPERADAGYGVGAAAGGKTAPSDARLVQSYHTSFSAVTQPARRLPPGLLSGSVSHDALELPPHASSTTLRSNSTSGTAASLLSDVSDQVQRLTQMQESVREMLRQRELEKERDMVERHNREVGKLSTLPLETLSSAEKPAAPPTTVNGMTLSELHSGICLFKFKKLKSLPVRH